MLTYKIKYINELYNLLSFRRCNKIILEILSIYSSKIYLNSKLNSTSFTYSLKFVKNLNQNYKIQEKIFCQFRLLTKTTLNGQFVHPVEGEGIG